MDSMRTDPGIPLTELAEVIRSKNAGPFELTLDIVFKDKEVYRQVKERRLIDAQTIAGLYGIAPEKILKIVYFDPVGAVKITLERPRPCGSVGESDVYGAQQHAPLLELRLPIQA